MKDFTKFFKTLDAGFKKNSIYIFLTYFFILLSYPLARSTTSAIFYEHYTSAQYSLAAFFGVAFLLAFIWLNNKLQVKIGIHNLFSLTGLLTILFFGLSFVLVNFQIPQGAFLLFAIKESYVVLLLHLCLAFTNAYYSLEQVKVLFGPLGAVGALGGILGGQITSYLAEQFTPEYIFIPASIFILCSLACFYQTRNVKLVGVDKKNSITPIKAVQSVKKYVFIIASIIALSQFVIFIADLQFNIVFEKMITSKVERTKYLGNFYSMVNGVSFVLQFFVLPIILTQFRVKTIFLFIPVFYIILILAGVSIGSGSLFIIGGVFIFLKGTDYSIFNTVKEVMYSPLLSLQKFGAKYLTDMFSYRTAKAFIAFIMAILAITDIRILTVLQLIFIGLWIWLIYLAFKEQETINK
mgnify:CR=1 FL=1